MSKFTTTLNEICAHDPCSPGWTKLLNHLGKTKADEEPLNLSVILESNGLNDAIWALRACEGIERDARLFAVWCARRVHHLMPDHSSLQALDVAERYANGEATEKERADAAADAYAPSYSSAAAAYSAASANAVVAAAASDASYSSDAAAYAAASAAVAAACDASARTKQENRFRKMLDDDGFVGDTRGDS